MHLYQEYEMLYRPWYGSSARSGNGCGSGLALASLLARPTRMKLQHEQDCPERRYLALLR